MKTTYNWKFIGGIGAAALVFLVVIIVLLNGNGDIVTEKSFKGTLIRTIDVTGKVVPAEEVDLAFTTSGQINSIRVKEGQRVSKGQVLATLDSAQVDASLRQAFADKNLAQAELASLVGNDGDSGKTESIKREAASTAQKALNVSITQVKTNVDSLFTDPQSGRPEVTISIKDYFARQEIGQQRVSIGRLLNDWSQNNLSITYSNIKESDLEYALNNLNEISKFITKIAKELSQAESNSSVSSATLSEYRAVITSAGSAIDAMISETVSAKEKLRSVNSDLPVQEAKVASASANIEKYQAQRSDYVIVAPFDGVVVDVPAVYGENVSSGQNIVSLISNSDVELEVFIPEVHMKDLSLGDIAKVKFDAFGDEIILGATVIYIEDRGVVRDGIVTYKTRLEFNSLSPDVRAGMTSTIEIDALVVSDVLMIPRSSVKISNEIMEDANIKKAIVTVLVNGKEEEKEITVGRSDSSGHIEVISGIEEGEEVVVSQVK